MIFLNLKNFYQKIKKEIEKILRQLCDFKKVKIVEAEAGPEYIHILVSIPPKFVCIAIDWILEKTFLDDL